MSSCNPIRKKWPSSVDAEAGAFKLNQAAPGVVRLALRGAGTLEIRTDWFRI